MFNRILEKFINKKKIKVFFSSKDVLVFLFFLLLSFCFWFLHGLRKDYEANLTVAIRYTNIPVEKVNENDLPPSVKVMIKDRGGHIISYKIKKQEPVVLSVKEDFTEEKNRFYIPAYVLQSKIKAQLHHTAEIMRTNPETIVIPIVKKSQKEIPIKYRGKITFGQQFNLSDSVQITPSSVTVYGDQKIIGNMQFVYTEPVKLKNLKDSIRKTVALEQMRDVQYSVNRVSILIPVEKFTEKTIEIPITGKNIPANAELRTFPSTLKVSFPVSFSKFSTVNANNFSAVIDYNKITRNQSGKLKPIVKSNYPFIDNIRTSPAEVEYLIEKK